jgi:rhodanese-related sulfurtransferase
MTRISPSEAFAKMNAEGFTYVDVRSADEFADGHPAGALNVPFEADDASAFVAAMEKRFAKDARLVVGCKSGNRSARAAQALLAAGFSRVLDQRAGWDGARGTFGEIVEPGWARQGLP